MKFSKLEIILTVFLVVSTAVNVLLYWSFNKTHEVANEILSTSMIVSIAQQIERQQDTLASIEQGDMDNARIQLEKIVEFQKLHLKGFVDHPDLPVHVIDLARQRLRELENRPII